VNKRQTYSQCDSEKLNGLLLGSLSQEEAEAVESHLSECASCAEQFELAAVPGTSWKEAQSMLALDEFDGLPSLSSARSLFPAEVENDEYTPTADLLTREIRGWLDPTDDPQMLGRFAGYEIVGIIGHGGMGIVLKGFEASLNRYVAIKVLAPRLATNGAARKRFAREAQAAAAVLHDNVVAIHRVDEFHGLPFLVMPYIAGTSLQKRINDEGPLPIAAVLRIGSQIAAGLAAAHHQGLVHRDIKPANILLEKGVERVTITDFGLARTVDDSSLTRTGLIAGTPQYMSPEQARGEPVDQRSDLFSLGSVLYAMCTGRAPFRAETSYGVLRRITDEQPRPIREINPDTPEWLCQIIAKLMSKQPDDRFESAREVAELLEECLAHVQQPTAVPLPHGRLSLRESSVRDQPLGASPRFLRKPTSSAVRLIAATAIAITFIFAGILVVLELNNGTVSIECDADDVPVRITQGDKVVKELSVARTGTSVRIAAGRYQVELLAETDRLFVKNGTFLLSRGGKHVVTIQQVERRAARAPSTRVGASGDKLWNELGVTPGPVSPMTARALEWIGLHLSPITRERFRDKNVFAKYQGGLDVTSVRTHGPAEKAGVHEADIVVGLRGSPIASLAALDSAIQDIIMKYEPMLPFDVLRSGKTVRVNVPFPVRELDLQTPDYKSGSTPPAQLANTRMRVLGANGRPVADNAVIRGTQGYSGPNLPQASEAPSHRGVVSLGKLAAGTHWFLVNFGTVLRIELPAVEELIEPSLPRTGSRNLIGKDLDVKVAVEAENGVEFIAIEIQNRTTETIQLTEANLQLLVAIKGPGADARVLSPLWSKVADGEALPVTTIKPDQTATLRIDWADWVKHGFWFSRDGEIIAEPCFPELEPGRTWVRVTPGSARPVSVTHPDRILGQSALIDVSRPGESSEQATPTDDKSSDRQSLAYAARRFNESTAEVRSELFDPPIEDLTVERLREGFRLSAELYRRLGKRQVADALLKIAESGRLPDDVIGSLSFSGTHAQDEDGKTTSRQVVPALVLPDNTTPSGRQLVALRPLELFYRNDGPVSKDYGDLFDLETGRLIEGAELAADYQDILGHWEVVSVEGSGGRFMSLSDQSKPGDRLVIAHVDTPNGRRWLSEALRDAWSRDDSLHLHPKADPSRLTYNPRDGMKNHFADTNNPPDYGIYRIEGNELTILAGDPRDFTVNQGTESVPAERRSEDGTTSPGGPAVWSWKIVIPNYASEFRLEKEQKQILVKLRRTAPRDANQTPAIRSPSGAGEGSHRSGTEGKAGEQAEQSARELEGDWHLESIVGKGIARHQQNVTARIRGDVWTDVYESSESRRRMVLDTTANPKAIDLISERERMRPPVVPPPPVTYRGIYDLRGDTLTIAWGRDDDTVRPTGFEWEKCTIFTWKKIKAPDQP